MEVPMDHPHPDIVGYPGCHVRRGVMTGLVLDRHRHDLGSYLMSGHVMLEEDTFVSRL